MSCDQNPPPPDELLGSPLLVPPAPGKTTLVVSASSDAPVLTATRECDAITAVKRGLREYLEQVYLDVAGARIRFQQVHEVWAEPDSFATFPAASIMATDEATYDYSSFTPVLDAVTVVRYGAEPADQKTYLVKYAEISVRLACESHCSSPEERIAVAMMLEDALNPVDWMYGFQLDLPHYFNQRAVFEPVTSQMMDTEGDARRRFRPGTVFLTAQVSLLRIRSLPGFKPLATVEVLDE